MIYPIGRVRSELDKIGRILKHLDLLEERIFHPNRPSGIIHKLRTLKYIELWKYYINEHLYDYMLRDNSLICFNVDDDSYSYLPSPYIAMSYHDFVQEMGFDIYEVGDELRPDFESYLDFSELYEFPLLVRYDYDPHSYLAGCHPASHLHVGFNNSSRIGIEKLLSPVTFLVFILRQIYPDEWMRLLQNPMELSLSEHYLSLIDINQSFYTLNDKNEFYLKL